MSFWKSIRSLFTAAESSSLAEPVVHEVLSRHTERSAELATWSEGIVLGRLKSWLADQYALYLTTPNQLDRALSILDTPSSKGFVVHFNDTGYSLEEAQFFQLYLRQKVIDAGYRTQVADTKLYSKSAQTEQLDRYYLKPRPQWTNALAEGKKADAHTANQFEQLFGNVLIELLTRNEKPYQLKFSATIYHDRVYKTASSFGKLMDLVLS